MAYTSNLYTTHCSGAPSIVSNPHFVLVHLVIVSSDRTVWNADWDAQTTAGYFNFCVSLYVLLGFCEDYKRVVINARHELILIRARNDNNCLTGDPAVEPTLELFKVQWRMPQYY